MLISSRGHVSTQAVAILDADAPPGLAFTRSLGRHGVPVWVYSPKRYPVARLSRYCSRFQRCPDPEDAHVFLPWLRQEVSRGHLAWVAPTSDLIAFYMAEFPEVFPPQQSEALASKEAVLDMLLKHRFNALCAQHHMPVPWTLFPSSMDEALADAAHLPYPVILKPKSHVGVGWARGKVVHTPQAFYKHYHPYPIHPSRRMVLDRFPELIWPMVQAYVPEALQHLYSISGILGPHAEVIASSGSRKTRQWPPTLGVGVVFESWYEETPFKRGLHFAQTALKRGLFELELIYDARLNDYVAIDLNPRAHGHISFDIARHQDLPLLWYRLAQGESPLPQPAPSNGVRWLHSIPYHVGHLIGLARGPQRKKLWHAYCQGLQGPTVDIVHDMQDPLPSLGHAAYMLRHPGGLIKPYIRE